MFHFITGDLKWRGIKRVASWHSRFPQRCCIYKVSASKTSISQFISLIYSDSSELLGWWCPQTTARWKSCMKVVWSVRLHRLFRLCQQKLFILFIQISFHFVWNLHSLRHRLRRDKTEEGSEIFCVAWKRSVAPSKDNRNAQAMSGL